MASQFLESLRQDMRPRASGAEGAHCCNLLNGMFNPHVLFRAKSIEYVVNDLVAANAPAERSR